MKEGEGAGRDQVSPYVNHPGYQPKGGGEGRGGGDISSDVSSSAILGDALIWVTRLYLLYSGWPDKIYSGI